MSETVEQGYSRDDGGTAAGGTGPASADAGNPPPGEPAPTSDDDTETPGSEPDGDGGNGGREAAKYRRRLRETEAERDQLADTLARTRQSIVDNAVQAAGLDPRLLGAAGHSLDSLVGKDGLVSHDKLAEAISTTAQEFGLNRPGLRANPQQGRGGPQSGTTASWSEALRGG